MRGVFRVDVVVVVSERAGGASLLCVGESSISSCACMYSCAAADFSTSATASLWCCARGCGFVDGISSAGLACADTAAKELRDRVR
jgi:hypothetical protein